MLFIKIQKRARLINKNQIDLLASASSKQERVRLVSSVSPVEVEIASNQAKVRSLFLYYVKPSVPQAKVRKGSTTYLLY